MWWIPWRATVKCTRHLELRKGELFEQILKVRCPINWGQRIVDHFGSAQIQRQSVEVVKPRKCGSDELGTFCSDLEQNVEAVKVSLVWMVMQIVDVTVPRTIEVPKLCLSPTRHNAPYAASELTGVCRLTRNSFASLQAALSGH